MFPAKRFILVVSGVFLLTEEDISNQHDFLVTTAQVINHTVSILFNSLGLKNETTETKIKLYSTVHNHFISVALQDGNSIQQIAKITRVAKNNINVSIVVILNEILNEDIAHKLLDITMGTENDKRFDTEYEQEKLQYLNDVYVKESAELNNKSIEILNNTTEINDSTEITMNNNLTLGNVTDHSDEKEFWDEEQSGRRLYKGHHTGIMTFPFMASIEMFQRFHCGGSIISTDLVITAASCLQLAWNNRFYRETPKYLTVRVGSTYYGSGGDVINVIDIYFHPGYNPKNLRHNIALLRLGRHLNFKYQSVKRINLDEVAGSVPLNVGVTVLGWGSSSRSNAENFIHDARLKYSDLPVFNFKDCQDIYSKEYVTHQHFCTGFITQGSGACSRDIGGPGIVSGKVVGIISFGAPLCGAPEAPTVFTKVGYYIDWIENIMEMDVKPTRHRTTTTRKPRPVFGKHMGNIMKIKPLRSGSKPETVSPYNKNNEDLKLNNIKKLLRDLYDSDEDIEEDYTVEKRPQVTSKKQDWKMKPIDKDFFLRTNETNDRVYQTSLESDKHRTTAIVSDLDVDLDQINDKSERQMPDDINSNLDVASFSDDSEEGGLGIQIPNKDSSPSILHQIQSDVYDQINDNDTPLSYSELSKKSHPSTKFKQNKKRIKKPPSQAKTTNNYLNPVTENENPSVNDSINDEISEDVLFSLVYKDSNETELNNDDFNDDYLSLLNMTLEDLN